MHEIQFSLGLKKKEVIPEFQPLQVSSLLNMLKVPTFGSAGGI
jgi:hypothetical protein